MSNDPYRLLAERLDELPNGFPPAESGVERHLLAKLYSPEEAALAAQLRLTLETSAEIAARIGADPKVTRKLLKDMTRRGLIEAGRTERGLGYGLMPFVVGIYEMQADTIDAELARLFEDYYQQAFGKELRISPSFHRVIPVGESIKTDMEIQPFESVAEIVDRAQAWGVLDCICRKQQALVGTPCEHPIEDTCMTFSQTPGAFDGSAAVRAITQKEAMATLRRVAEAGLVHSVTNNRQGMWYICNCCTCSCAILRGIAKVGIANAIARSAFVNRVDESACIGCGACVEICPFEALSVEDVAAVDEVRCLGCGVCTLECPVDALSLVRRPESEILPIPATEADWRSERAAARGLDLNKVL